MDQAALAYYRYERVIQDIAAFGEQILLTEAGGEDREQGYQYFTSNFLPGHEIDLALQADPFR
jgi:spectinomycin phosphotransferase